MLTFHITPRNPDAAQIAGEVVSAADVEARIDALAGRTIGSYIVRTAIPSTRRRSGRERAYVAVNRDSEGARLYGGGFLVSVIRPEVKG